MMIIENKVAVPDIVGKFVTIVCSLCLARPSLDFPTRGRGAHPGGRDAGVTSGQPASQWFTSATSGRLWH